MLTKIMNYFFPVPKTMLELAKEKVLAQTHVFNGGSEADFAKDQFFVMGTLVPHKAGKSFDSYNVMFSHDGNNVAIKKNQDVLYYFNTKQDVEEIRQAIIKLGSKK